MTGRPLARVSPNLLRLALTSELQAKAHGGLPRRASQKLDQLGGARTVSREAQVGMWLVRKWSGKVHVVAIDEDKVIPWNERKWGRLSEVARAITGTHWSGPAFFGLKARKAAVA